MSIGNQLVEYLEELQEKVNQKSALSMPEAQFIWDTGATGPLIDATDPMTADGRG